MRQLRRWLQTRFTGACVAVGVIIAAAAAPVWAQNATRMITTTGVMYVRSITGFNFTNGTSITSSASGTFTITGTTPAVQYGGTSASFPMWKRNGAALNARLADDSGDAAITAAAGTFSGAVTAPGSSGYCFSSSLGCIKGTSDGVFTLLNNAGTGFARLQLGGTTSSFPAWKQNGAQMDCRLADDSAGCFLRAAQFQATANMQGTNGNLFYSAVPASAPSSCGTSPVVTTTNGSIAFVVTGGTGGTATGCTVTMPAAANGWNCNIVNITQTAAHRADRDTRQTASTTTSVTWEYVVVSTGAATAFTASDVFRGVCIGY